MSRHNRPMVQDLRQGRDAFDRQAWAAAYEHLSVAAAEEPLDVSDLERLAAAAYLVGRRSESTQAWTTAHQNCVRRGGRRRAPRDAVSGWRSAT